MKLLLEQWREYLKESVEDLKPISVEDLKHISATPWSSEEAKHEWGEEVNSSLEEGDDYIGQRWPGLNRKVIEKHYPFFLTAEDFAEALVNAPIKNLSPSEMKEIENHAQVYDIIEMYEENDKTPEPIRKRNKFVKKIHDKMYKFFKGHTTDADASGKTYAKESSYQRWVKHFKEQDKVDKPPIVLQLPNGGLAHIGGQTRQTGALTNQKIIPYAVLAPIKGESGETPT